MKKSLAALAAAVVVAAVVAMPAASITGNFVKDFDHPFVGLIAFYDGNGDFMWRCSGSLISENVVLTAGHCTDQNAAESPVSARVWFEQDAGVHFNGTVDPYTGYPTTCTPQPTMCATSHQLYDYGFDEFAGFPNTHDVGILILDSSPSGVTEYGQLPDAGALDSLATKRGLQDTTVTVSGYGVSRYSQNNDKKTLSYRERLMAQTQVVNLNSANNGGYNVQLSSAPAKDRGGTCFGDSGGPTFYPSDSNTIVAVDSFVLNGNCRGTGFAYRLDRSDVLDWIAAHSS